MPSIEALEALWAQAIARQDADVVWRDLVEQSRAPVQAMFMASQHVDPAIVEHFVCSHDSGCNPLSDPGYGARLSAVVR